MRNPKLKTPRPPKSKTTNLVKNNPKGRRGLFREIAFGKPSVAAQRKAWKAAGKGGAPTDSDLLGAGSKGEYFNPGDIPDNIAPPTGPARRKTPR